MEPVTEHGAIASRRPISRDIARVVLAAALILLVPLVAMQFTKEVSWGALDFAVASVLLIGTGTTFVILSRTATQKRHRVAIGLVLAVALLLVWAELAVGIFGTPFAGS